MCLRPIKIKVDNAYRNDIIEVPCGKCEQCLKRKQNDWIIRLFNEFKEHTDNVFFTLTYRNEIVPKYFDTLTGEVSNSVCKKHIQDALKRFRIGFERAGNNKKWKYFITSEYGPKTQRPHYHGVFFGLSVHDLMPFFADWKKRFGFVHFKPVSIGSSSFYCSSRYISKYAVKGIFENEEFFRWKRKPVFRLVSKGLGLSYVKKNFGYHVSLTDPLRNAERSLIPLGRCFYPLPRYYKNKFYENKPFLSLKVSKELHNLSLSIRLQKQTELQTSLDISSDEAYYLVLREEVLSNRHKKYELRETLNFFYKKSLF